MNKYIIGFILIALAGICWLVYKAETVDYAQTVNNEVNHFESELVQQEVVINRDGLTQGVATIARARLITQLDIIWDTVELAEVTHVSKQQEFLLLKSIEQLEQILVDHGETINTVEVTANPHFAESDPQLDSVLDKLQKLIDLLETHIGTVTPQTDFPSNNIIESDTESAQDFDNDTLLIVPQHIFTETSRTELDLSHNYLTGSLPAEIRQLKNLQILDISHNQYSGVPAEIGQLSELKVLNLSHNQLTSLPHELGNLQNLMTLDLRGNNYSTYDLDIIIQRLPDTTDILVD